MSNISRYDTPSDWVEINPDGSPVKPTLSSEFVTDSWLAEQLQMAVATIRSQRFKRLHGHDHWLDIAPTYIGSRPRYRRSEALAWIHSREHSGSN
jgi:hypothetical protein